MWFLKRYPSSFLRLILVGYGVVLLPLLFASAYGLHSVEHLADDGESSMRAVVRAERFRREVADQMLAMERLLRQELVVRDLRLMDDYATLREEWRQTTLAFMKIDIVEPLHLRFVHLLEVEDAAYRTTRPAARTPRASRRWSTRWRRCASSSRRSSSGSTRSSQARSRTSASTPTR